MASWHEDAYDRQRERELADRSEETAEETIELEDIDEARRQRDTQQHPGK